MADAELVVDIGVEQGQVGDRIFAEQNALIHQLVDEARALLLVGADAGEPRRLDGRGDHLGIDAVEVHHPPRRVGLAAERHDDETDSTMIHDPAPALVARRRS